MSSLPAAASPSPPPPSESPAPPPAPHPPPPTPLICLPMPIPLVDGSPMTPDAIQAAYQKTNPLGRANCNTQSGSDGCVEDLGQIYPAIGWVMSQGYAQQVHTVSAFTPQKMVSANTNVFRKVGYPRMSLNDLSDPWFNQHTRLENGEPDPRNLHDALNWTNPNGPEVKRAVNECDNAGSSDCCLVPLADTSPWGKCGDSCEQVCAQQSPPRTGSDLLFEGCRPAKPSIPWWVWLFVGLFSNIYL